MKNFFARHGFIFSGCCALIVAASLATALPKFIPAELLVIKSIYYVLWLQILLLTLSSFLLLSQNKNFNFKSFLKAMTFPLAVGMIFTAVIFLAVRPEFRVLADEVNLLGSSLSFYLDQTYKNISEGYFYYDLFHPVASGLDVRPPLFSFLISIMHSFFGYSAYNGFVVNFFATWAMLTLAFVIGKRFLGNVGGFLLLLLLLAEPVFTLTGTSSGFDQLNALLLMATLWTLFVFCGRPSIQLFEVLAFLGLFCGSCRYESILVLIPIAIVGFLKRKEVGFSAKGCWRLLLLPTLIAPTVWHRMATSNLNSPEQANLPLFAARYVPKNLISAFWFLFDFKRENFPTSVLISVLAGLGLLLLLYKLIKGRFSKPQKTFFILTALTVVLIATVHFAFYMGDLTMVVQHRIGLPYALLAVFLAVFVFSFLFRSLAGKSLVLIAAFVLACIGLAKAGVNERGKALITYREYKMNLDFLKNYHREGTLIISEMAGLYAVHLYGSIDPSLLQQRPQEIMDGIEARLYPNTFIVQKVYYDKSREPAPRLPPGFKTITQLEYQNGSEYLIRVSRLEKD